MSELRSDSLPNHIGRDEELADSAMDYVGVLNPVLDQFRNAGTIMEQTRECLTMNPEDLDNMSLQQIDKYLILLPKALIWLQENENLARIAYEDALSAYEDTIQTKAALLDKKTFDVSQISEKMRVAKVREMFPDEYDAALKELRTKRSMMIRLDNQTKHLERMNDNIKKVRESFIARLRSDKGEIIDDK